MIGLTKLIKSRNQSLLSLRKCFSVELVNDFLASKGYDSQVIKGIIDAFPNKNPRMKDIEALGEAGLKSLAEAVKNELKRNHHQSTIPEISIHIEAPHQKVFLDLKVREGDSFYQLARHNEEVSELLECACSGIAACSTCHVIVDPEYFIRLPPAEENELDMLDLAWGVTETSRLGCQIRFNKAIDGLRVTIPEEANNLFS